MKILPFHKHIMRILEKFKSATYLPMRMPKHPHCSYKYNLFSVASQKVQARSVKNGHYVQLILLFFHFIKIQGFVKMFGRPTGFITY